MCKTRNHIIAICILFFTLITGCTELYKPDLQIEGDVFYLEGGITNQHGPQQLSIRKAVPYNGKETFEAVKGAIVYVMENETTRYDFSESSKGNYVSDPSFAAKPGDTYQLFIEGPDGELYQSNAQKMPTYNHQVDSIYGYKEIQKLKYYNTYNELIVKEQEINQIYVDIPTATENTYYRLESWLVLEHAARYIIYPYASEASLIPYYMYDSFNINELSIMEVNAQLDRMTMIPLAKALNDKDEFSRLKLNYAGQIKKEWGDEFYRQVKVEVETDSGIVLQDSTIYGIPVELDETKDFYYGWVVAIAQYSITREAYTFWSDVKKLEEADGEIFDPIATQLRGNITCVTNEDKVMSGLFEVANISSSKGFVNFDPYNGTHYGRTINHAYTYADGYWQDSIPPDNWVDKVSVY